MNSKCIEWSRVVELNQLVVYSDTPIPEFLR